MFDIRINWNKIIYENVPHFLRNNSWYIFLSVLTAPFKKIYNDFIIIYNLYLIRVRYNGQVCYLENILNKTYSPVFGGIYITDGVLVPIKYWFRRVEQKTNLRVHKRWDELSSYNASDSVHYNRKIYTAKISSAGFNPLLNPSKWLEVQRGVFIYRRSETKSEFDFIVNVPAILNVDLKAFKTLIDYYRLAGKTYLIKRY